MSKLKQHLVGGRERRERHERELCFYSDLLMSVCAAGQTGGVYQSVHHEVVLPVFPGQSEYILNLSL